MNPDVKFEWVEALRSGRFKQGTGKLWVITHDQDNEPHEPGLCCLGVLCYLAELEGVTTRQYHRFEGYQFYMFGNTADVLPEEVKKWAGLEYGDPRIPGIDDDHEDRSLAFINDNGADFDEIADLIDKYL
jgi:hypothetical protein